MQLPTFFFQQRRNHPMECTPELLKSLSSYIKEFEGHVVIFVNGSENKRSELSAFLSRTLLTDLLILPFHSFHYNLPPDVTETISEMNVILVFPRSQAILEYFQLYFWHSAV